MFPISVLVCYGSNQLAEVHVLHLHLREGLNVG